MAKPTGKERVYLVGGGRAYDLSLDEVVAYASGNLTLPAPTAAVRGGVLRGPAVANQATLTVAGADVAALGTSATTVVNALGTKINAVLVQLRAAGIIAP
jgi:hypothetical protein